MIHNENTTHYNVKMTLNFVQRCQWVLNSDRRYQEFTDWKDLDLALSRTFQFQCITNLQSRITLILMLWSEGYHKNTVYRVIFAMLFLPPITLPFYTCKKFWPVFILPRQSRYKHSYSKIILNSLSLKFPHWKRGRKEHI